MKAFKDFIKPFQAPQKSVKIKIFLLSTEIGTGKANRVFDTKNQSKTLFSLTKFTHSSMSEKTGKSNYI